MMQNDYAHATNNRTANERMNERQTTSCCTIWGEFVCATDHVHRSLAANDDFDLSLSLALHSRNFCKFFNRTEEHKNKISQRKYAKLRKREEEGKESKKKTQQQTKWIEKCGRVLGTHTQCNSGTEKLSSHTGTVYRLRNARAKCQHSESTRVITKPMCNIVRGILHSSLSLIFYFFGETR